MSGYNKSEYGNPQLTFPFIADQHRTLGSAYFRGAVPIRYDIDMGVDQYGWGADANRMANAKVQSTIHAQRLYDRTPRYRVEPTGLLGYRPFFANIDQAREGRMTGGVFRTEEGREYGRKLLAARADQLRSLEQDPPVEPSPPAQKELTEKEAIKETLALEFNAIEDELESGVAERSQVAELAKWNTKFFSVLPYYDNADMPILLNYQRRVDSIMETLFQNIGEAFRGEEADKKENVYQFAMRLFKTWDEVIRQYLGQPRDRVRENVTEVGAIPPLTSVVGDQARLTGEQFGTRAVIDMPLQDRIKAVKAILRRLGIKKVEVLPPAPEDEAQDVEDAGEQEEQAQNFADVDGEEDGEVPPAAEEEDQLPEYRTQAQITAEMNRRVADGEAANVGEAIRQIAAEWEQFTNYVPRAEGTIKSIRQTLVQRIKAALQQQGIEVGNAAAAARGNLGADAEAAFDDQGNLVGQGRRVRGGRSSQAKTYPIQYAKEQRRQMEKVRGGRASFLDPLVKGLRMIPKTLF